MEAVQIEEAGDTGPVFQLGQHDCMFHAIFGHVAIGGPFATGDGEQPGIINVNGVAARERRGVGGAR